MRPPPDDVPPCPTSKSTSERSTLLLRPTSATSLPWNAACASRDVRRGAFASAARAEGSRRLRVSSRGAASAKVRESSWREVVSRNCRCWADDRRGASTSAAWRFCSSGRVASRFGRVCSSCRLCSAGCGACGCGTGASSSFASSGASCFGWTTGWVLTRTFWATSSP
ncbi:MAG: hypothetical protein C0395_06945 [Gemmatimonas sp.]|nr:hypothetical protein [Gemmatimonas sp.]